MGVLRWLARIGISLVILILFFAGVMMQLYGDFYLGLLLVLLSLGMGLFREIWRVGRQDRMRWRGFLGLGFSLVVSLLGLLIVAVPSLLSGGRAMSIILLNSALSTFVFLLGVFMRVWKHWKERDAKSSRRGTKWASKRK
ncbi:MAG: hypothetical protein Sv326_1034 [Candidatus Fermentimicrarchaeum limneticum]|uniref:Uncharacterized protein n=1 Tax=Fermentimicrarchaeum limneticum TaxID=2795018 RepID=A0A7D5XKA0_FERL1|nr:MAG: hypothetical protein Sv326_1034 [Candidatus Fermentimicrarchaeum limneticum]